MESIIEQLYYGNISELDRRTVVKGDAELRAYDAIYNRLNAEEKALFDKFKMSYGEELRATFERGFKMGARIAIEIAEFDIDYGENKKDKAFKGEELVEAINILRILLEYHICKLFGIDKTKRVKSDLTNYHIRKDFSKRNE